MTYRARQRVFWKVDRLDDWLMDHAPERVWLAFPTDRINTLACLLLGHLPIPDNCGLPEHDGCAYCHKAMPGAAHRTDPESTR